MKQDYNQELLTDFILLVLNFSPYSRDHTPPALIELHLSKSAVYNGAVASCLDAGLIFKDDDVYRLTDAGIALFTVEYIL